MTTREPKRPRHPSFPHGADKAGRVEHVALVGDPSHEPTVVVTRALCPMGHDLISDANPTFGDGWHGIALHVRAGGRAGIVYLSPIHGDMTKLGFTDLEPGADCVLSCPICGAEFPVVGGCSCEGHGRLYTIYLSPVLKPSSVVGVCSIWGCPRSRVMDNWEIVSEIVMQEGDAAGDDPTA